MLRAAALNRALTARRGGGCPSLDRAQTLLHARATASARPHAQDAQKLAETDERMMRLALLHAREAAANAEVPVGAVLTLADGEVIAEASNAVVRSGDPTAHAEILCIREASRSQKGWQNLESATLYVTLEPCAMCAGAILQTRLAAVVWGAANPLLGADGSWVSILRPPAEPEASTSGTVEALSAGTSTRCACCGQPRRRPHPFQPALVVRRVPSLEAECGEVMKAFFAGRRKEKKEQRKGVAAAAAEGGSGHAEGQRQEAGGGDGNTGGRTGGGGGDTTGERSSNREEIMGGAGGGTRNT